MRIRIFNDMISLNDIINAYKRAKVDAWFAHTLDPEEFVRFECNFEVNIKHVQNRILAIINGGKFKDGELGGWRLETKSLTPLDKSNLDKDKQTEGNHPENIEVVFSNPTRNPSRLEDYEKLSFRLLATPSVLFHVISALWISRVGYKFDAKLDTNSYGNRMRPMGKLGEDGIPKGGHGDNRTGSFVYYIKQFREWREKAIKYVVENLKDLDEDIVVVTADAHAFYHCLNAGFLTDKDYLEAIGLELKDELDLQLTALLQRAISFWAKHTPLTKGLPVGLPASAVIANAALCEFDQILRDDIQPVFYGRYVDDILLVFKWIKKWQKLEDIWSWMSARSPVRKETSDRKLVYKERKVKLDSNGKKIVEDAEIRFEPEYKGNLTNDSISFKGSKCKAFFLDTETGLPFVEALRKQIRALSSEFRLLPERAGDEVRIRTKIMRLVPNAGTTPDNFRKIDSQEFRRSDFIGLLKELETFERVLPVELWKKQRDEFYSAFTAILVTWPLFVDFEKYLPRVVGLMVRCADFDKLTQLLDKVDALLKDAHNLKCEKVIAGPKAEVDEAIIDKWKKSVIGLLRIAILSNIKGRNCAPSGYAEKYTDFIVTTEAKNLFGELPGYIEGFERFARAFLVHDVSNERLSQFCQRTETRFRSHVARLSAFSYADCLPIASSGFLKADTVESIGLLARAVNGHDIREGGLPLGLVFPTRPVSVRNLAYLAVGRLSVGDVKKIIRSCRGYEISPEIEKSLDAVLPGIQQFSTDKCNRIIVSDSHRKVVRVALMSIRTSDEVIHLQMKRKPPRALLQHYKNVLQLVNDVLRNPNKPQYILFHELAMPALWFVQIAEKCHANGVSLISGVDYIADTEAKTCTNEIWMSLVSLKDNFPELVFISEKKNRFAYAEENDLRIKYGYSPAEIPIKEQEHSIIVHGDFAFSALICSELLEMSKRCRLIGKVDALFVASWNQDRETFDEIIRSAATDIHAYVVFCNNNEYGDSRVRVPRKDRWARDIVEVRGGDDPYYVIGKLEIDELRKFQSHANPNLLKDAKFKPLPMGFEMDSNRRVDV